MNDIKITNRSKIRTNAKRAVYDFETIVKILDDTFLCHIGFVIDNQPFVIPTCFGRKDDKVFFHGAKGSRMLKHIKTGFQICLTVSIVDGIVLARSVFHHSINYRSVVVFGEAEELVNSDEKFRALKVITNHIIPGRWDDARLPYEKELNATSVFSLTIEEASAKVRTGGPIDEKEDMNLKFWAGVLPLKIIPEEPIKDAVLNNNILLPDYIKNYRINNVI